jgi:uncharacterized membrane protein YeaQ/YmgE (transglycosylase-associated protein family)
MRHQGDPVWGIDGSPAGLCGVDQLVGHSDSTCADLCDASPEGHPQVLISTFDAGVCFCAPGVLLKHQIVPLEEDMTITGIITAILIGIVIGVLGRMVAPGKQNISILVTVLVGIVAAFVGTALARAMGIPTATNGIDWLELLVQVIVAAVGVGLVSAMTGRRKSGLLRR